MKQIAFLITTLAIVLFSCGKPETSREDADVYVNLSYQQTKCSDPWATGASDSITLVNLSNYLESRNLYFANAVIRQDNLPDTCTACTCKTGKIIYITTLGLSGALGVYDEVGFH